MLSFIILFLILIGIAFHHNLSSFWEQGRMPYSGGFLFFSKFFHLIYLSNFIWFLGVLPGIIISALCFFDVIYSSIL